MSPLRWTSKSTRKLAEELATRGYDLSPQKVGQLLHASGYSLQATHKTTEGTSHPDRNAQFEFINDRVDACHARGSPVVSVDTKKKELVGDFKNAGSEWQPRGEPVRVRVHDFIDKNLGKAIPYGVYDVGLNAAWVSVGVDHDTAEFAVGTIGRWWLSDRFHVQRMAQDALDQVRREQVGLLAGTDNAKALKKTRWALLKSPWNLTAVEGDKLVEVQRDNRPLYRAYLLKESLAEIFNHRQVNVAREKLNPGLVVLRRKCHPRINP